MPLVNASMKITTHDHLAPLLAMLPSADNRSPAVGRCLDEEDGYAWLDEEMMKVGSLHHASVDWQGAEAIAISLLSEHGKDLRVLGHLLHCLQRSGNIERFSLALQLLGGVLESWWNDAWPFTGKRGSQARHRLFGQIAQRSLKLASHLVLSDEVELETCHQACNMVITAAEANELPTEGFIDLQRAFDKRRAALHDIARPTQPASHDMISAGKPHRPNNEGESDSPSHAGGLSELHLESDNPRANRQALLKLADFLNVQSPGDPLGYRLRRHAIWHTIQALPATRDGRRTELAPVADDRVAEYREAVSHDVDPALWQRIEASLAVSPFWLEGHRLSAEVARALGHPSCAEAIHEEAARFIERLSGIDALSFNDDTPFVDAMTRRWLNSPPRGAASASSDSGAPWWAGLEEARGCLAKNNLQAALRILDTGLATSDSLRESAYWRLASAELLEEAGISALAQQHYQALRQTLADADLTQWEPALLVRLEASQPTQ